MHASSPTSFRFFLKSLISNRGLIYQLAKRDTISRYKGSMGGIFWSVITPILMLSIYTFVFSAVFKAKWSAGPGADETKVQFAIVLFAGLIAFNLFAEIITKAPSLITSNANYVKKIVFPLEVLSVSTVLSALFNFMISVIILLIAFIIFNGYLNWTVLWLPVVFFPLVILCLGLSWLIASLGVFIRDINQIIGILLTVIMFLSPIFYPSSAIPEKFKPFLVFNPLAFIIEQSRNVVVWNTPPDFIGLTYYLIIALLVMKTGFVWFQKTRKGFADVL